MLALTRKKGQSIRIGEGTDAIVVTLCQIYGSRARIGIEAPRHVPVMRSEIDDRWDQEEETPNAQS